VKQRHILFVTDLDVWMFHQGATVATSAGNQSFYNTLLGYARAGWDVDVLTAKSLHAGTDRLADGRIRIQRVNLALQAPVRAARRMRDSLLKPRAAPGAAGEPGTALGLGDIENPKRWLVFQTEMFIRVLAKCLFRRPDILYGYEVYGAPVAVAVGKLLGIPSVTRFQGTLLGQWADDPASMTQVRTHCAAMRAPADLVVMADDGTLGDVVLQRLGVASNRIRFWMNGVVKEDVFAALARVGRPARAAGEPVRLFTASRLVQWKRVDRALDLLVRLPPDLPPWSMVIGGDGPERDALVRRSEALGLADRVRFAGSMGHDAALDELARSDIYLAFNDISNLSNGVIEAIVAGRPVFTLDVGGTNHLVHDGVNGILVSPERLLDDGVQALASLIADPGRRAGIGRSAEAFARDHLLTWEQRMDREVREVTALLRGTPPRTGIHSDDA
jgi:glycosyltransferase involved in cell wall biosynthesis